jgi:hypothetical protein
MGNFFFFSKICLFYFISFVGVGLRVCLLLPLIFFKVFSLFIKFLFWWL